MPHRYHNIIKRKSKVPAQAMKYILYITANSFSKQ
jgi:hypothetical protein